MNHQLRARRRLQSIHPPYTRIHEISSNKTMDWDALCFNIATFLAGVFVLDYGADKFIDHTVIVGRRLGISQSIIALLTAGAEWEEVCNPV